MPDYSYLAGGVQVDPFAVATKAQNLQNLQLAGQGQQISNATTGGNLNEVQNARALLSSPGALNPDGSLTEATRGRLAQVAPTLGSGISQGSAAANTAQTGASKAHFQLTQDQAAAAQNGLQALYGDSRVMGQRDPATGALIPGSIDPTQATSAIKDQMHKLVAAGVPEEQVLQQAAPILMMAGHNPEGLPNLLGTYVKQAGGPALTANVNQPSMINTGQTTQNVNPFAQNSGAPTSIDNTVRPGEQQTPTTDTNGNPALLTKDARGNVTGATGIPGSGGPAPQMAYPVGESAATKTQLETDRQSAQNVATSAPQAHANNQMVLQNIDKATVGQAGPTVNKALSVFGALPGFDTAEHAASSYDIVGKALERNALVAAQAMGPNTNAGLTAQIAANGSQGYNPTAIKEITKLNDALTTGAELYSGGLQTAISNSPNGVFAKRNFDTQWGQNFDVNAAKIYQAAKTGDTDQVKEIVQSLGGPNSPAAKQMLQKAANIQLLATQGHL